MRALLAACCGVLLLACDAGREPAPEAGVEAVVTATAVEHVGDSPSPSPLATRALARRLVEQRLAYGEADGRNLSGFLAMPADAADPLPGLIVVHEWWGLNDNIVSMARQLAAEGYIALAVDLYAGETADDPDQARDLMSRAMSAREATLANIRQAYEYLDRYAHAPRVGVIGWGLGGGLSLQAALMLPEELDAAVMYYGQVVTEPALLKPLQVPLLGVFGGEDASIGVREVQRFRAGLRELGKRAEVLIYPRVGHDFANPSGGSYDTRTAEEAWRKTLEFLTAHLGPA